MSDIVYTALLQPETIHFPDGHPFMVRTMTDEKIYYPHTPGQRMPFIRKMSGITNGAYNFETIVFSERGQAVYTRTLNKNSATEGTWSNDKQAGTFDVSDNILTEYDAKKKIVRQSHIDPITHALSPAAKCKLPADIYTNVLNQEKLLAAFHETKPQTDKHKPAPHSKPVNGA